MKVVQDILVTTLVIALYWIPTIVGVARNVRAVGQVAVVNGFFGWTFIGWVVALVMSFRESRPREPKHSAA